MRNVPSSLTRLTPPHKLIYVATLAAILSSSAIAQPYSGDSLVVNADQEASYDSVSVEWTAGNEDEAGVLLETGSTLNVSGDFTLTSQSGNAPTVFIQQGLLVKVNSVFNHTGENFSIEFKANSTSTTDMGAAYFGEGSTNQLGANASISSTGTAETLWGVRLYGDLAGDSLTITTTNEKTAQSTQSEQGFAVGLWAESDSDITYTNIDITANGAGNRTDGMMIYGAGGATAGTGSIGQLTISAHNSGEEGKVFGINFYQAQNSEAPVNFALQGQTLKIDATSEHDSATGIVSTYGDTKDTSLTINYGTIDLTVNADQSATGIDLVGNPVDNQDAAVSVTASDLLKVEVESTSYQANGVNVDDTTFATGSLDVSATALQNATGVYLVDTEWTTTGAATIAADSQEGRAYGLRINNSSGEEVLFENSLTVVGETQSDSDAYGIYLNKGTMAVDGVASISANAANGTATGIYATGNGQNITFNDALNASAEGLDEASAAVKAQMGAVISAEHGGQISSNQLAIHAYRGSQISLSYDETSTLNIVGDVKAERWGTAYSKVTLTLGDGSTWVGDAEGNGGATVDVTLEDGSSWTGDAVQTVYNTSSLGKVKVTLQGGAWTLAGEQSSATNQVLSEGGTIDITNLSTDTPLTIADLQANSGETVFYTDTLHNGTVATVTTRTGSDGQVGVVGSAALNDSMSDKTALVTELSKEVSLPGGLDFIRAEESLVSGEVLGTIDPEGNVVVKTTESRNTGDMRSAVALRARLLQQESSGLPDRLQLIRDGGQGTIGGWASISGQEMRYDGSGAHSQDTSVKVGFDTTIGGWVLGGSFTYIDSDLNDFTAADAEGDTYVFSLYGQRNFESGAYVGAAVRYLRAETDYRFEAFDVDWQQNGWGLALESGHRFAIGDVAFVEPKVALSYAHFGSDSFTSQNVEGDLDSFDALIGSVGLRAGFTFPENRGALYAKASVNNDLKGEADGRIRSLTGTAVSDIGEDLGDTWFEYGVGGTFRITPNWNAAVDLSRTTGGEVQSNWIANVSMRYVW